MFETQLVFLLHLVLLDVPLALLGLYLLVVTYRIEKFQKGYGVHLTVFRGILALGYLFVVIGLLLAASDYLGYTGAVDAGEFVETFAHATEVAAAVVVAYSFSQYYRVLKASEKGD